MQAVQDYLKDVARKFAKGNATEHTYRESLVALSDALLRDKFELTNEPKRQACGAPDYILEDGDVPIGYIEAKDVGVPLDRTEKSEQMQRYLHSLDNLILTDYLEFRFYRKGILVNTARIGEVKGGKIVPVPAEIEAFCAYYIEFSTYRTQSIKNSLQLAEMMAKKAVLVKDVFRRILASEEQSSLHDQFDAFRQVLLHDVTREEFADIYAETLAYGLFTARLHDKTLDTFSRGEAYNLIPRSNPFLRELFAYVGTKLDERAEWIVDELCDVFRATDVKKMLGSFNKGTGRSDPYLHFYETFLGQYNPQKKKARGVWYTPESVVGFIVRSVDQILQDKFKLEDGLADTSTTTIKVDAQRGSRRGKAPVVKVDKVVHRVQVLDVATGTGTFLAEVISQIHEKYKNQQGMWSSYVEEHLIPRLHGFELLMASYAMCHMKLEILLDETGYKSKSKTAPRLNVYLTNSLQKPDEEVDKLPLIEWFSRESNEASYIKKNAPIMVAIGNPPYSGISSNMGDLIVDIEDYKYVDGEHFGEKKHWLHDDYVKFIRLGEHFVEKNGEGVMGYITNHSYLDNPTFRGMRWHLLRTFDEIYILDLHGNANRREVSPDGSPDNNVFDIRMGVSILLCVRKKHAGKKKTLAKVSTAEIWGTRDSKYTYLEGNDFRSVPWKEVKYGAPFYFFKNHDNTGEDEYRKGFSLTDLLPIYTTGVQTGSEERLTAFTKAELQRKLAQQGATQAGADAVAPYLHKAFDTRWMGFFETHGAAKKLGIAVPLSYRSRYDISKHMAIGDNHSLIVGRSNKSKVMDHFFASDTFSEVKSGESSTGSVFFPLYIEEEGGLLAKQVNFDPKIWKKIKAAGGKAAESELAVFDYIYAVLFAPSYRSAYATFLRSHFPTIPYPKSPDFFSAMAKHGELLRLLHNLKADAKELPVGHASYPVDGDHLVEKVVLDGAKVLMNDDQYFDNVPEEAWEFTIGGYSPAQKWLKDRRGRNLVLADIKHYQKIIATIVKTLDVMGEVEKTYAP